VRRAMLEAVFGEYRFICDADLSMPIEQVNRFFPPPAAPEIAIGSARLPARALSEPAYRHLVGRIFNTCALGGAARAARYPVRIQMLSPQRGGSHFPLADAAGMSFDVEVLFIAQRMGFAFKKCDRLVLRPGQPRAPAPGFYAHVRRPDDNPANIQQGLYDAPLRSY